MGIDASFTALVSTFWKALENVLLPLNVGTLMAPVLEMGLVLEAIL
jgi:hypothetical protein